MYSPIDTIVAIATPPGRGGIGVVRLSGPGAHAIAQGITARRAPFEPRHATLTTVVAAGRPRAASAVDAGHEPLSAIDQVVVTFFPAPASYTGDDVIEISAHGSPVVLKAIVAAAMACGARLAEPGEFTLRAYLNGRMDLTQAEAVGDLIDAVTPLQARAAFDQLQGTLAQRIAGIDRTLFDLIARLEASVDFPEEGYHFVDERSLAEAIEGVRRQTTALLGDARRGRLVREGMQIAIVGAPNVGKSSLFNALVGSSRAIVTEVPGTTRDLVTETIDLDGLRVLLVDTAGVRETHDLVELEGVTRSFGAARVADLILVVVDGSAAVEATPDIVSQNLADKALVVINKADLISAPPRIEEGSRIWVSAKTGAGMDCLRRSIVRALDVESFSERPEITNVRHIALVQQAHDALARASHAAGAAGGALPEEFVLADLQQARSALEEITGTRTTDDLLAHIFARFCIGK